MTEINEDLFSEYPEIERDGVLYLKVCKILALPKKGGKNIYFDEETQVAIFNTGGKLFAISNICPHQHSAVMFTGFVEEETITCPLHGWIYSMESGKALGGGAKLKTYKVFEESGEIYIEKPIPIVPKWLEAF